MSDLGIDYELTPTTNQAILEVDNLLAQTDVGKARRSLKILASQRAGIFVYRALLVLQHQKINVN